MASALTLFRPEKLEHGFNRCLQTNMANTSWVIVIFGEH